MTVREAFLERVKNAVAEGNRAGLVPPLPDRAGVGYQGAGPDEVERFCDELAKAGGTAHLASDADEVARAIQNIMRPLNTRKILLARGGLVDHFDLHTRLMDLGFDVMVGQANAGDDFFAADVGITTAYRLIAETGSVVVSSQPNEPRSVSLLPPAHICLAERWQILPDLFDLFDLFAPTASPTQSLPPSCLTLITGPSKTGDIELKLVTGVHGPGEVHVIVCEG